MRKLYLKFSVILLFFVSYFLVFIVFDTNDFSRIRADYLHNITDTKMILIKTMSIV